MTVSYNRHSLNLLKLESGWVSAMAQGHGISMMVRAAQVTADASYWIAAQRALAPFKKLTHEGGVRNNIMGIYPWFEEYPFTEGMIRIFYFGYHCLTYLIFNILKKKPFLRAAVQFSYFIFICKYELGLG